MEFNMELVRQYHTKQIDLSGEIITVPSWANYIAIDKNGIIYVYSHKPKLFKRDDGNDYWLNDHERFYDINTKFALIEEIHMSISKEEDIKDLCFCIGEDEE